MIKKEKIKINFKIVIISLISFFIVITVLLFYTRKQNEMVSEQTEYTICQKTREIAEVIDSSVGYALNSIQVTSIAISNKMTSETLDNPAETLGQYIENTPFSSIEYIREDGMNYTNAGDPFDASDREYYIKGMEGHTGIWINYQPRYSKEPLLNFYTPLYFERKIVGVITGTIGGNTDIQPLLYTELYGEPFVGMLLDKDNKIISSTEAFEPGLVLEWDNINVDESDKQTFLNAVNGSDGSAFYLKGKKGKSIGSVKRITSTEWKIVQIVPSVSLVNILGDNKNSAYITIGIVLAVSIILFLIIFADSKKISRTSINKANTERDEQFAILSSLSNIYYSMHVIDLPENTVTEYTAHNEIRTLVKNGNDAINAMHNVIVATIEDKYVDGALAFTNLVTVSNRMCDKKIISEEFVGIHTGWIRMAFITIEADPNGYPIKVIFATQIIDDEKRKEQSLITKSTTDELTKFYNRSEYETCVSQFTNFSAEPNMVYVSMDISGLKTVNDTLGHAAGDELIIGAASCMKRCFGNYGRLYRTGGDEFVAIIYADDKQLERIKDDFIESVDGWSGKNVKHLAVACGYVPLREYPKLSITEIAKVADKKMYEAKAKYYMNKGIDRRGQLSAHKALCNLYTKILKINLTKDTFQIINMNAKEISRMEIKYKKISSWLIDFAKSGNVHPDDVDKYLKETDINTLQNYFKAGKKSISIIYRRLVDDQYLQAVMEIIPADDYQHDNQNMFLYVKAIDG